MYIPSYDFDIFDLPDFSPLQAQEFGADTSFRANTPTSFLDWSLNQFAGLMNPNAAYPYIQSQFSSKIDTNFGNTFFQSGQGAQTREQIEAEVAAAKAVYDKAVAKVKEKPTCPPGFSPVSVFGLFSYCGKDMLSDGDTSTLPPGIKEKREEEIKKMVLGEWGEWFKSLPKGSGVFLIAVVVIILLLLFVRR